jgi:tetratricopeptide (TPR) repeat protein
MKSILAVLLLLMLNGAAFACLNEDDDEGGEPLPIALHFTPRDFKAEAPTLKQEAERFLQQTKKSDDPRFKLGYAVRLIQLGEYDNAQKVLQAMAADPATRQRYAVAGNLGTLYELMGKNELAYKEIVRALKIKPEAHYGSEWIHRNILDVKRTPGKPASSLNLIETDFGDGIAPRTTLSEEKLKDLSKHLRWQLHERMNFVHPEDSIVARLLFDLANIDLLLGYHDLALENYEWARKYGMEEELLEERIAYVPEAEKSAAQAKEITARAEKESAHVAQSIAQEEAFWERLGGILFPVIALLGVGIYFLVQRLRKRKA